MRQRSPSSLSRAFTLVELFAALAIIALLLALLLPVSSRIRAKAIDAGCVSNLRTIGAAIQMYANDHDMLLPGSIYPSFGETYSGAMPDGGFLPDHLWTYLNLPPPSTANNWTGRAKTPFECPAYSQRMRGATPFGRNGGYTTQTSIFRDGVEYKYTGPFGLVSGTKVNQPIRLVSISGEDRRNKLYWAVSDLDSAADANNRTLPGSTPITSPIHGNHRNQLFFDMHVEAIPFP